GGVFSWDSFHEDLEKMAANRRNEQPTSLVNTGMASCIEAKLQFKSKFVLPVDTELFQLENGTIFYLQHLDFFCRLYVKLEGRDVEVYLNGASQMGSHQNAIYWCEHRKRIVRAILNNNGEIQVHYVRGLLEREKPLPRAYCTWRRNGVKYVYRMCDDPFTDGLQALSKKELNEKSLYLYGICHRWLVYTTSSGPEAPRISVRRRANVVEISVDSSAHIYAVPSSPFIYVCNGNLSNNSMKLYAFDMRTVQSLTPLEINCEMDPILGIMSGVISARGILNRSYDDNRYCLATAQLPPEYYAHNSAAISSERHSAPNRQNPSSAVPLEVPVEEVEDYRQQIEFAEMMSNRVQQPPPQEIANNGEIKLEFKAKFVLPEDTDAFQLENGTIFYLQHLESFSRLYVEIDGDEVDTNLYGASQIGAHGNAIYWCERDKRIIRAVLSDHGEISVEFVRDLLEDEKSLPRAFCTFRNVGLAYVYRMCDDPCADAIQGLSSEEMDEKGLYFRGICFDNLLYTTSSGPLIPEVSVRHSAKIVEINVDSSAQIYAVATSPFVYVSNRDKANGSIQLYVIDIRTMQNLPPLSINCDMDPILGVVNGVISARGCLNRAFGDKITYCLSSARLPHDYYDHSSPAIPTGEASQNSDVVAPKEISMEEMEEVRQLMAYAELMREKEKREKRPHEPRSRGPASIKAVRANNSAGGGRGNVYRDGFTVRTLYEETPDPMHQSTRRETTQPSTTTSGDSGIDSLNSLPDAFGGLRMGNASDLSDYSSKFLNEFTVRRILGEGGFGCVFQAVNDIDQAQYAVKRVAVDLVNVERALGEVRAMAQLDHPGIVRFHGAWIEQPPEGWQRAADERMLDRRDPFTTPPKLDYKEN
ncbi:hypothetical protein PRIPAC_89007, partial [Pristionchus pacificus]